MFVVTFDCSRTRQQGGLTSPEDPIEEELARNWTLSEAGYAEVLRCRGDDNRRRFALQRQYGPLSRIGTKMCRSGF
jgi:hypothetical protein